MLRGAGGAAAALVLLVLSLHPGPTLAQDEARIAEYRIKATFLFKFLPFIEWPPQAFERRDSPLVIGVLGAEPLADELEAITSNRPVGERRVQVRRLRKADTPVDLHVVFVSRAHQASLAHLLAANRGRALLTVAEAEDAAGPPSVINFVVSDDRVRFDIALRAAEGAHLVVSSRLLALARRVSPASP